MVGIPIIKPEEMSIEEISEISEDIKKEEKRRKKVEEDYIFNAEDIKELNRRLADGEDLEEITRSISERGIASRPPPSLPPTQPTPSDEPYLIARAKKREKKILISEETRIDYPVGECCSNVCDILNKEIEQYLGIISPDKDTKLKFDALRELRRQFYLRDACQCADGHAAQKSGIPLKEKQTEDCCPKVCSILNNTIDEYEGIMFPTHKIRITSETLYNIRAKMYNNNACKCVGSEEQLKRPSRGGPAIDPVLINKLAQLVKYAEKQGWVRDAVLMRKFSN